MNRSKNVVSKKSIGLWDYIYSKINTLASLGHLEPFQEITSPLWILFIDQPKEERASTQKN